MAVHRWKAVARIDKNGRSAHLEFFLAHPIRSRSDVRRSNNCVLLCNDKGCAPGTGRICSLFLGFVSSESQSVHIANCNCDRCGRAFLARYPENSVLRKHICADALLCHGRAAYRDLFLDLPAAFEVRAASGRGVEDGVLLRHSPFPQNSRAASSSLCRRQPDLDFPAGGHFCPLYASGACVQNSGACVGQHCKKQHGKPTGFVRSRPMVFV